MSILRVAVVSDIHAQEGECNDSYVTTEPPPPQRGQHPLADLLNFVADNGIVADYIMCPGDISNRADDAGKVYGWQRLQEIGQVMGGARVIATPGNHDLATHAPIVNPTTILRSLTPSYPTGDSASDRDFWDNGFTIFEEDRYRVVVLNSCYDFPPHPGSSASSDELAEYLQFLDRGGFPEALQVPFEEVLSKLDEKPVNILLCHHHPSEHESRALFKDTYGAMRRGEDLLRILEENHRSGRWLVIHGHKHIPRLVTTAGLSSNSPILLCAASVGGRLWHPIVTVTRNQFHIVTFEMDDPPGLARLRGTVESFMWGFGAGWDISSRRLAGLPGNCGFGMMHDHRDLARQVATHLADNALEFQWWHRVLELFPQLRYQGPTDVEMFESYLRAFGLILVRDRDERVLQVAREVVA